ncbi:MAG: glycosyltransferase family 39 protein [Epsilonproteobacteria bacterium]|nr:glycosyltransferase family 39 protein [Campylobacterota bacterium]
MHLADKIHQRALCLILGIALVRLLLAPFVGLGVDEAHYLLYALHLDWSYFDHPPLVGWTQYVFTSLFGMNEFGARVGAILIGAVVSYQLYRFIFNISQDETIAWFALLALHASFLFNALFLMLMPDTLLFVLLIPIIETTLKIEKEPTLKNWALLALLLGVGGLAKYTAVLFIIPIVFYFLLKKRYELFWAKEMLFAIPIGLLLISPVIYWNIEHDWASLSYQSNHVVGSSSISWSAFFSSIGAQFGAYNPLLFFVAYYGLYKAVRSSHAELFLSGLFGVVFIGFFGYASLYKTALPHWSALFYLLFIPIGSYFLYHQARRYLKIAITFGLILSSIAYAELGLKLLPLPDYQSLHRDIYGWEQIMQEANKLSEQNSHAKIAVTNWTLASRALFYNLPYPTDVVLADDREDQFDIWGATPKPGDDLLFINTRFFKKDIQNYYLCGETKELKSIDITLNGGIVNSVDYILCRDYGGVR